MRWIAGALFALLSATGVTLFVLYVRNQHVINDLTAGVFGWVALIADFFAFGWILFAVVFAIALKLYYSSPENGASKDPQER